MSTENPTKKENTQKELEGGELSDNQLDDVSGGLNPQPLPPGIRTEFEHIIELNPQPLPPG